MVHTNCWIALNMSLHYRTAGDLTMETAKKRYRYYCILSDVSCKSVLLTELCWAGGGPIETSFGWCSAQAMEEQVDGAGMGQVAP